MIRYKILTLLFSVLLTTSLFGDSDEDRSRHIYKNLDYLDLSSKQLEEIKDMLKEYRKKYAEYIEEKEEEEEKLKKIFKKDRFDREEYEESLEEIYEEAAELEAETIKKMHSILTPTQREEFIEYLREWRVE